MNVGQSVTKAIDDFVTGHSDSAMLHACNAIDGTASKRATLIGGNNKKFTDLLRSHYDILGPMGMPGIDIDHLRLPVALSNPKAPGGGCDLADVIYGIHRCSHGHGDELPNGFELLDDAGGLPGFTRVEIDSASGTVRLSDRIIFGLLAVAVMAPENADQSAPDGHFLTYEKQVLPINQWWGRAADFSQVVASGTQLPSVKIEWQTPSA